MSKNVWQSPHESATHCIGIDRVDPYFYPGLEDSRNVSAVTKQLVELVHIARQITLDLRLIGMVFPDAVSSTKLLNSFDINPSKNKLTMTFQLFGIMRIVEVTVGVDANSFVCPRTVKRPITVFLSAFTPKKRFFETVKPTTVIAPPGEFSEANGGGGMVRSTSIPIQYFTADIDLNRMYPILNVTKRTDPLLITKATVLTEIISIGTIHVFTLRKTIERTRKTRRTRKIIKHL